MSCGVGRRHGWNPVLLWLCCRPVAVSLIQPLDWELSYATGVEPKKTKKKKKKKTKEKKGLEETKARLYLTTSR